MSEIQETYSPEELAKLSIRKAVEVLVKMHPKDAVSLLRKVPEHRRIQISQEIFDKHFQFSSSMLAEQTVAALNEHLLKEEK